MARLVDKWVAKVGVLPLGFMFERGGKGFRSVSSFTYFGRSTCFSSPDALSFSPFKIWLWGSCEISKLYIGCSPQPIPPESWTRPPMLFGSFVRWVQLHCASEGSESMHPVSFDYRPFCAEPYRGHPINGRPRIEYSSCAAGEAISLTTFGQFGGAVVWGTFYQQERKRRGKK